MTRRTGRIAPLALTLALSLLLAACSSGSTGSEDTTTTAAEEAVTTTTAPVEIDIDVPRPVHAGGIASLVPRPAEVRAKSTTFPLLAGTTVVIEDGAEEAGDAADLLRTSIGPATGLDLPEREPGTPPEPGAGTIAFRPLPGGDDPRPEAYEIDVTGGEIAIRAADHDGFIWAVQTLRQMLPAEAWGSDRLEGTVVLPGVSIVDSPRFEWRGTMLDISRHFFGPEVIEAYIDQISIYKINRLHLHLSDDQGWRIEIRSHPDLAVIGGANEVGGGPGGYLTQDEYREIVAYAAARGITIVPEIDVPGHTNAAAYADPDLDCSGREIEPYTKTQVGFSSLCTSSEYVYEWFSDVVGEIAEMTPGEWFHLGGDESHSTEDEDYAMFVERALGIVRDAGKTPIGWDEVGSVDMGGPTVIQHWRSVAPEAAVAGVEAGAKLIMSPSSFAYFDMKHTADGPGNSWAAIISTEVAYSWDPAELLGGIGEENILGVEAPVWTELIDDLDTIRERTLPRIPALAEIGWTARDDREWADASKRIASHGARWDALGWAWTRDPTIPWP